MNQKEQLLSQIGDMKSRTVRKYRRNPLLNDSNYSSAEVSIADEARAPVKTGRIPTADQWAGFTDVVGLVVDLGFASDMKVANILSIAGAGYMDALITSTIDTSAELCKRNIKCWPIDQMQAYTLTERNGHRR